MGIPQLLPHLREAITKADLSEWKGKKAGIDISIWLYRGSGPQNAFRVIEYLEGLNIQCVPVFDGAAIEAKRETHDHRKKLREQRIKALENAGKSDEADKLRNEPASRSFVEDVKQFCRTRNVEYYQAPFEADVQLAYLLREKFIDVVITEDADLIVFGCEKILLKLNSKGADFYDQEKLNQTWVDPFNLDYLRAVCILVGCDYMRGGLKGFGPVRAKQLYEKLCSSKRRRFSFDKMVAHLKKEEVVDEECFMRAYYTFLYQLVFDPETERVVPFTEYPDWKSEVDFPYAGTQDKAAKPDFFIPTEQFIPFLSTSPNIGRPITTLTCMWCPGSEFKTCMEHRKHKREHHKLPCKFCDRKFMCESSLEDHLKSHAVIPSFDHACDHCEKRFITAVQLCSHKRLHLPKTHECLFCNKKFREKSNMINHLRLHLNEKWFVCKICGADFKQRNALKLHASTHSAVKPCICSECGDGFYNQTRLRDHISTHHDKKRFICPHCGKNLARGSTNGHLKRCKANESTHKIPKIACPDCGKKIKRASLYNHKKFCKAIETTQAANKVACPDCGLEMKSTSLRQHQRKICKRVPIQPLVNPPFV